MGEPVVIRVRDGFDYRDLGGLVKRVVFPQNAGIKNAALAVCFLNPGEAIITHDHHYEEIYFVVTGTGTVRLDGREERIAPYHCVYIPGGCRHGQVNDGDEPLVIVCVTSPPAGQKGQVPPA